MFRCGAGTPISIGNHARLQYEDIEANGAARPIEFPDPIIHRGCRISVLAHSPKSNHYHDVKNILIIDPRTLNTIGSPYLQHRRPSASQLETGYYLKRRLSKSVYGFVYKAVVVRKRKLLPEENEARKRKERRRKRSGMGSYSELGSIVEDDDWDDDDDKTSSEEWYEVAEEEDGGWIWEATGEVVVVKVSSWSKIGRLRGKHLEDPLKEIRAMQLLGNYDLNITYNIVAMQDDRCLYCVMPYYKDGDLCGVVMNTIKDRGRLRESYCHEYFIQLLRALHHLQQKGVSHRDVSLENIMTDGSNIRLIDFGLALRIPHVSLSDTPAVTDVSEGTNRTLVTYQGLGGNITYAAPELVGKEPAFDGFAIDLWAAGVVLYVMLIGHRPFEWAHGSDDMFVRVARRGLLKECLKYWNIELSGEAVDLLQNMLWEEKDKRLTLAEIMEHPWIVNNGQGRSRKGGSMGGSSATSKRNRMPSG